MADSSVKRTHKRTFSAGDSTGPEPDRDSPAFNTQPTNSQVRKKSKQTNQPKVSASAMESAINCVAFMSQSQSVQMNDDNDSNNDNTHDSNDATQLHAKISQLESVVKSQSVEIIRLNMQMSYILKYLEISDANVKEAQNGSTTPPSSAVSTAVAPPSAGDPSSNIVVVRPKLSPPTARAAAVAAVYVEQTNKKRRSSSLVVSGMLTESDVTDDQLFVTLCQLQFDIRPDIVSTKRLGRPKPGYVQPLLVILRNEEAASQILSLAKSLRQSADECVRKIYINANLTKAEASAAYQIREQRREAAKRKQSSGQQQQEPSSHTPASAAQSHGPSVSSNVTSHKPAVGTSSSAANPTTNAIFNDTSSTIGPASAASTTCTHQQPAQANAPNIDVDNNHPVLLNGSTIPASPQTP